MPKKKSFGVYYCFDCEIDFLVGATSNRQRRVTYCPKCGDYIRVERQRTIWMERPFLHKRPWTREEDSMLILGRTIGKSYRELAEALEGRTKEAICSRYSYLKKRNGREFTQHSISYDD